MQFSTALLVFLAGMIAVLYLPARMMKNQSTLFLLLGMMTSYVDYLTYPIATLGMPLIVCVLLYPEASARDEVLRLVRCCLCWAIGYFGMWAGKWVIVGLSGTDKWFWPNLVAKIAERSSSQSKTAELSYLDVLMAVFKPFVKRAYLGIAVMAALALDVQLLRGWKLQLTRENGARVAVLGLIGLMPFAWYFCTKNHTHAHAFFTSRALTVSVFAWTGVISLMMQPRRMTALK